MSKRKVEPAPVLVCRWKGHDDRFFGKFKDGGAWCHIPGGVFPDEVNTRTKALAFARQWYTERHTKRRGSALTFRKLGEAWTDGELHRDHPDYIKSKSTSADDAGRLENHVYPIVGHKLVGDVTLEDAQEVMRRLPASLSPITRRSVAHTMSRLLKLAVFPLQLIAVNPIPTGFLPSRGPRKALAVLYPDEVRRLLACPAVPFAFRLLWGFLTAEGCREGEALALTWADLELKRGSIRLDKNKTDDPRAWALDKGTAAALRTYRERYRSDAQLGDRVFLDPDGRPHTQYGMAELLRAHLEAIGLKAERPELFESTETRRRMRVHDLRGTFVTVALANNRTEAWISDRTGHRSSVMLNVYKRTARNFLELDLGPLTPLDQAIPELGDERGDGGIPGSSGGDGHHETPDKSGVLASSAQFQIPLGTPKKQAQNALGHQNSHQGEGASEIESALSWALVRALERGETELAAALAAQLIHARTP